MKKRQGKIASEKRGERQAVDRSLQPFVRPKDAEEFIDGFFKAVREVPDPKTELKFTGPIKITRQGEGMVMLECEKTGAMVMVPVSLLSNEIKTLALKSILNSGQFVVNGITVAKMRRFNTRFFRSNAHLSGDEAARSK